MDNKQALIIIKQIMDAATKGGLFENMDATFAAANAYNHIQRQLIKEEKDLENANGSVI